MIIRKAFTITGKHYVGHWEGIFLFGFIPLYLVRKDKRFVSGV